MLRAGATSLVEAIEAWVIAAGYFVADGEDRRKCAFAKDVLE